MFGRKQEKINMLTGDVKFWHDRNTENFESGQKARQSLARKESELSILQEAFCNGVKISEEQKEKIEEYAGDLLRLGDAHTSLLKAHDQLAQHTRDLEYQNSLLVTVLQTLQIPVKLPARKK